MTDDESRLQSVCAAEQSPSGLALGGLLCAILGGAALLMVGKTVLSHSEASRPLIVPGVVLAIVAAAASAVLFWREHLYRQGLVARVLASTATLAFPACGFRTWLLDSPPSEIVFVDAPESGLVATRLGALSPAIEVREVDTRRFEVALPKVVMNPGKAYELRCGDLPLMRRVIAALEQLHAEAAIEQVEFAVDRPAPETRAPLPTAIARTKPRS